MYDEGVHGCVSFGLPQDKVCETTYSHGVRQMADGKPGVILVEESRTVTFEETANGIAVKMFKNVLTFYHPLTEFTTRC